MLFISVKFARVATITVGLTASLQSTPKKATNLNWPYSKVSGLAVYKNGLTVHSLFLLRKFWVLPVESWKQYAAHSVEIVLHDELFRWGKGVVFHARVKCWRMILYKLITCIVSFFYIDYY